MKQRILLVIAMLMTVCSFCKAEELNQYTVYDPADNSLTFYYDEYKYSRQINYDVYSIPISPQSYENIGWVMNHSDDIKTVKFDDSFAIARPTSTCFWFCYLENLTTIENIENLNTSEVTNMSYMFSYCTNLKNVDVTHFNTSQVSHIHNMFYDCSKLETLDLTNWDTSNVIVMASAFYGCEGLTSITSLEKLNLSKVTSVASMFDGCKLLRILDLGGWNTSNVKDMSAMFRNCSNLKSIIVGDKWSTANVTQSNLMFAYCSNLVGGEGTTFSSEHTDATYARVDGIADGETIVPGYLTRRPSGYAVYTSSNKTFTFYNDGKMTEKDGVPYLLTINGEVPEWLGKMTSVTNVVFHESFASAFPVSTSDWFNHFEKLITIEGIEYLNTDKVTEMSSMFNACYKLQSLDLSTFNTSNVTNMTMMFSYCSQLEELDLRNFDTSNVTSMLLMFSGCSLLTELDLRSFDTHNVKQMDMMFQNCTNLVTIYANDDKWNTDNVETGGGMFYYCTSLVGGNGTRWSSDYGQWSNQSGVLYARIDGGPDNPGYLTSKLGAYALYDNRADINTLTFYYDDQRDRRFGTKKYDLNEGTDEPGWITDNCYIEKVVFDETFKNARPTSTFNWFYNRTALESITGLENLNTSEVTNMFGMFRGCSSLTTLTFGTSFNTSGVTNMGYMFSGCSSLTELNLSKFNTSNVTNMSAMFLESYSLKNITLSNFNTISVKDMGCMFDGCSVLTALDLSSFNTSNVIEMPSMFYACSNLKTITVGPDWSTQNVTVSSNMFHGCEQIKGSAGTTYNEGYVDKTYAHVDGLGGPGYLTAVSYGIKVSGKAVTFANKYDVLGDETVYYDDDLNILTLNNASLTSISIASSAPNNLRIEVCGDCKVAHTASSGSAFTTNIASTTIQGVGKLTITSKNGAGIMINRLNNATLTIKDLDLKAAGKTAGILGRSKSTTTFYSSLVFNNTNCTISRIGADEGSVGIIRRMRFEKCTMTSGEFDKINHLVLANPMVVERNSVDITTGIENGQRNSVKGQRDEWYTIDGQKLSGKPTQKGIYIHNGHKRVIK